MSILHRQVHYKDRGLKKILRQIRVADTKGVRVGLIGPEAAQPHPLRGNLNVAEVGVLNEFGSRKAGVPRRSFLRGTLNRQRGQIRKIAAGALARMVLLRWHGLAALDALGAGVVQLVRDEIQRNIRPANHPRTIRAKGHGHTLLHTGTLVDHIKHDVINRKGELKTITGEDE